MADLDAAFVQQFFDVVPRQRKPDLEQQRQAKDLMACLEVPEW